jgi:WD40 repeat protein
LVCKIPFDIGILFPVIPFSRAALTKLCRSSKIIPFETVVWRVSWSLSGNVLAVSAGDNKVSLWKENLRGEWECVKSIEE